MSDIFIPTLSFWENGNTWYGNRGLAKELSEILEEVSFPLSPEGLEEMTAWLEQKSAQLNP